MQKLIDKIKTIPKDYFTLNDLKKISHFKDNSLKVIVNRLVKSEQLIKLGHKFYSNDTSKIDWEKLACEIYAPSYLSFEWALAKHNVLSQQPMHLTLATSHRTKTIKLQNKNIFYHHLKPELFWGYTQDRKIFLAEPEKAWLDLAYLSLNGYAKFDVEEMNLALLDKNKLKEYLKKFKNKKLEKVIFQSIKIV